MNKNFLSLILSLLTFLCTAGPERLAEMKARSAEMRLNRMLLEHPEMGVMACIRESKRLMAGRKGELFVMDLSFIGWTILTIIPFVSIFVTPYMQTTFAAYYLAVVEDDRRGGEFTGGWEDGRPGGDENGGDNPREY